MEDLNDVLKDQSNNDKLLIKELSKLVKNHKEKNKPINKEFIMSVIKIIQSNDEDLLLKSIEIENPESYAYAEYGNSELILHINEINKSFNYKKYKTYKKINDKRLLAYKNIIQILIHEFTHCKQEKLANEEKQKYYELSYELCRTCYEEYLANYDIIPIERYAELRGNLISYEVLSRIYDKNKLKEFKLDEIDNLMRGYFYNFEEECLYSPLERFDFVADYEELPSSQLDLNEYKELYNRLYLGLNISIEEYNRMIDLYYENEEKNPNEHIKTLINKKCQF